MLAVQCKTLNAIIWMFKKTSKSSSPLARNYNKSNNTEWRNSMTRVFTYFFFNLTSPILSISLLICLKPGTKVNTLQNGAFREEPEGQICISTLQGWVAQAYTSPKEMTRKAPSTHSLFHEKLDDFLKYHCIYIFKNLLYKEAR